MRKILYVAAVVALLGSGAVDSNAQTLPGLVSWWQGENNVLDSIGTNHGSIYVPPPPVFPVDYLAGKDGQAFKFNGGRVIIPNNASLMPASVTVQVWVKGTGIPAFRYILCKGGGAGAIQYAIYSGDSGTARFFVFAGGTYVVSPPASASVWDGNWHQLTGVWDGTGSKLYMDGVEVGITAGSGTIDYSNPQPLVFGDYLTTAALPYPGMLDEVKIFDRALPAEDVLATFNDLNAPAGTVGLVSHYKAEGNANDSWGTNHGSDGNATPPPPRIFTYADGKNGIGFFAKNGVASAPDSAELRPANLTLQAWVKSVGPGPFRYIAMKSMAGNGISYALYTEDGGGVNFWVNLTGVGTIKAPVLDPQAIWDGAWHLVTGSYDGANVRLYVDGLEVGTGTPAIGAIEYTSPTDFIIGDYRLPGGLPFYGQIDDIELYDRALTAGEILQYYTANKLVSWWKAAMTAEDAVGSNDGSLSGTASYGRGRTVDGAFNIGSAGSVQVPDAANLRPTNITVEAMVLGQAPGANKYLVSKSNTGTDASYALFTGAGGGLSFYVTVAGGRVVSPEASATIWDGAYHAVAGVYDGSKVRLYVDGKEVGSGTAASGNIVYGSYQSGKLLFGDFSETPGSACFAGMLDDIKIYNAGLSAKDVANDAFRPILIVDQPLSQTFTPTTPVSLSVSARSGTPLTYQWIKDGVDIAGATKSSLVLTNPPEGNYSARLALSSFYTNAKVNVGFDSASRRVVRVPNAPEFYTNTGFSVQLWAKGTGVGNFKYLIAKARHPSFYSASYGLYSADTGGLKMFVVLDGATYGFITASTNSGIWDNAWHQITGTWDGNFLGLYVDGALAEMTDSFGGGDIAYTNDYLGGDLILGDFQSSAGDYHFPGVMDEVKFFDRALTDLEIADMFANPSSSAGADALVSWWNLDNNLEDSVANHDGYVFPPSGTTLSDIAVLSAQVTLTNPMVTGGNFQATVNGGAGTSYVVLRSTDLNSWTPIITNAAPFTFMDPVAAGGKYYRARSQ